MMSINSTLSKTNNNQMLMVGVVYGSLQVAAVYQKIFTQLN